jgi:hypothetical protein
MNDPRMKKRISYKRIAKKIAGKSTPQVKNQAKKPDEPSSPVCYTGHLKFREGFEDISKE